MCFYLYLLSRIYRLGFYAKILYDVRGIYNFWDIVVEYGICKPILRKLEYI